MPPNLSIHTWLSLPNEVRFRVRSVFSIPRSSNTVVNDGRLESDGVTHEDLRYLTIAKMQTFLNEESTDFHKLFDRMVARITDDLFGKPVQPVASIAKDGGLNIIIEPKKRGRPRKNQDGQEK